jgi:hypothetical protein
MLNGFGPGWETPVVAGATEALRAAHDLLDGRVLEHLREVPSIVIRIRRQRHNRQSILVAFKRVLEHNGAKRPRPRQSAQSGGVRPNPSKFCPR